MWNFVEMIPITMILGPWFCSLRKRWIKLSTIAILMFFFGFQFLWFKWQYYLVGKKKKKRVKLASSTLTTPSRVTILFLVCNSFSILITKKENKIFKDAYCHIQFQNLLSYQMSKKRGWRLYGSSISTPFSLPSSCGLQRTLGTTTPSLAVAYGHDACIF